MSSRFAKIKNVLSSFGGDKSEDFLDSSSSETLKNNCLAIFPPERVDEFDNYSIAEEIGRGNMGIVYKALHKKEKKTYALKVLPRRVVHDPQAAGRFFQEICIHKTLSHKNIIQLHKIGVCAETVFIVMEYILGRDLGSFLQNKKKFDPWQALHLLVPILEAMIYAHKMKIVHRDLKPANILLEEGSQQPKIADFGLAKISSEQSPDTDYVFGTPAYMSPEQIISSKNVDIRADIYALGSILYHMLSGKRPYAEIFDPIILLRSKIKRDCDPIEQLVVGLDKEMIVLVSKAMARNVKHRYQNPEQFLADAKIAITKIEERRPKGRKKSPRAPSQQLKMQAANRTSAFLPKIETSEIFMTATRYEVNETLNTFQREVNSFKNSPVGSILEEEIEEEDGEYEGTLLTITMVPEAALQLPPELQKLLIATKAKNLFECAIKVSKLDKVTSEQKYILNELRYLLLLRGHALTKPLSLLEYINHGNKRLELRLDEMSRITQSNSFNKKVRQYFYDLTHSLLQKYDQVFRGQVISCKNADELGCYLENYSLHDESIFKQHKNLRVVKTAKQVHEKVAQKPQNLEKILNKHFGAEKELYKIFIACYMQKGEDTLWRAIMRSMDLVTLIKHLQRLQQTSEFESLAAKILNLINAFIDAGGRSSLEKLKTSLNFIPQQQNNKICFLVRRQLNLELQEKAQELFRDSVVGDKKYKALLALLRNPRYDHKGISLHGYSCKVMAEKIVELKQNKDSVEKIFSEKMPPREFLSLVYDGDKQISLQAKNFANCQQELEQLKSKAKKLPSVSVLKSILKILHQYGKFNFAQEDTPPINGYQLGRFIIRFFTASSSKAQLPPQLHPEIHKILLEIMTG